MVAEAKEAPTEAPAAGTAEAAPAPAPAGTETAALAAAAAAPETPKLASDEPTLLESVQAPGTEATATEEKPAEAEKPAAEVSGEKPAGEDGKKPDAAAEDKPEDKPKDDKGGEAAKPDAKADAPKAEPVEYKYQLPETITMDDALKGEFHGALDEFRANPAEGAQKLIDLHQKTMTDYAEHLSREQHRIFSETRKGWQKEIMADPVIGGAGHKTASQAIARVRDMFVSDHAPGSDAYNKDFQAWDGMLRVTGVGDHPVFWRFLHNVARLVDEPQAHEIPTDIRPALVRSGRKGASVLYDHPKSSKPQ